MEQNRLTCAYSTCPNDTFIFCHWAGKNDIEVHLHDVETLNRMAFEERFDITKLSFHAWLLVQDKYQLLSVGAALGRGCGPLVVSKKEEQGVAGEPIPHLRRCGKNDGHLPGGMAHFRKCDRVAIPGEYTTAHLLLRLWLPQLENRIFMPFDQIMDAVESGEADAGVIIHEGRFVFEDRGFQCLQDLGAWWEGETGLPIPLGCIAVRKSLGAERIAEIEQRLKQSIQAALNDPGAASEYVKQHAQELEDEVIGRHIETYVNSFTLDLGDEGRAAIDKLQQMAETSGIIN